MLNKIAIVNVILASKIESYSSFTSYNYRLKKAAAESATLLSRLGDLEDSIVNDEFHSKIASLLFNYKHFLEEINADKTKDLAKIGFFSDKIQNLIQSIAADQYLKSLDDESDDFDASELTSLLKDLYDDLIDNVKNLEEIPDYDEMVQIENVIKSIMQRAIKEDQKFNKIFTSGDVSGAIEYLEEEIPEFAKYRAQLDNFNEINEDLGQFGETGYGTQGVNVIDLDKRRQKALDNAKNYREQIQKLIKINPNHPEVIRLLEYRKQYWQNIVADPEKHKALKQRRLEIRNQKIQDLELRSKTDPKALEALKKLRDDANKATMKYWNLGEKTVEKKDIRGNPIMVTKQLDVQMLRNKFVVVKARDFAKKLANNYMKQHPEFKTLTGKDKEAKAKEFINDMKKTDAFAQFVSRLPAELDMEPEIVKIKAERPEVYLEIMKSVERLKSKI